MLQCNKFIIGKSTGSASHSKIGHVEPIHFLFAKKLIHGAIAKSTVSVFITAHAKKRMKERKVTSQEVYKCLQLGQIVREPEVNQEKESLECQADSSSKCNSLLM